MKKFIKNAFLGLLIGMVNGMLGAGGGMLAVPALKSNNMCQKEAHANAVAVILPISVVSAALYVFRGSVEITDAVPFAIWGIPGAILAALILKKISPVLLKILFGGFMVWAGIRMLFK
ncbi:MAG: sulfite exporter TauE/SafE family protein [Ruminococcaceae bacterium]|nr:sulfite exporter TauE/SafE family protein [Oscillospiraceae bacterium]